YGRWVVSLLDVAVALEQVNDREVGRSLAIRHRGALQHQPPRCVMGMDELIDQARLSHARLADHGHHLAMTRPGPLQRLLQNSQLLLPSHEAGEPTRRAGLQAPAAGT